VPRGARMTRDEGFVVKLMVWVLKQAVPEKWLILAGRRVQMKALSGLNR
jgi:hypothetical protein